MTYQALARKWRPQKFADIVGQEAIVTALRNALREGRIAQAYLFSGIRGVGKTTAARVLAKALNCVGADGAGNAPATDPCNECLVCREITQGGDLDVLEIDAATYSKVEQVRDLTESLKYGPARDRFKVVVLDEIHRLSRQAFDALLKIVEEPPSHLTFIFATTEIEMVPATILSRCQEFHFRRVPADPMVAHLRHLCEAEQIEASRATLRLIARASEGSVRDAVALLDQLATFGGGKLADEDVGRLLGGIDTALASTLLEAILAGNGAAVSQTIRTIEDGGSDPRQVFTHFLGYLRSALHLAQGLDREQLDLPAEAASDLEQTATAAGYESLLRLLHLLLSSETVVRRADAPGLALEVALLRAAELPRLVRIEQLAGALPAATQATPPRPAEPSPRPAGPTPQPPSPQATVAPSAGSDAVSEIKRLLAAEHASLAGRLLDARFETQGDTLVIEASAGIGEALQDKARAAQLNDVVRSVLGAGAGWKTTRAAAPAPDKAPPPAAVTAPPPRRTASRPQPDQPTTNRPAGPSQDAVKAAKKNPAVRAVLDVFDGHVVDVRPRTR